MHQNKPTVKDTKTDATLTEGTDYTLSYSEDVTNAGTVTVTVTGIGNYEGEFDIEYAIEKRTVVLTSETDSKPYDGTPLTRPDVTITGDGFVEGEVKDVKAIGSVTDVGPAVTNIISYTTTATFNLNNYSIKKSSRYIGSYSC